MAEVKIQSVISSLRIRPVREATWNLEDIGRELAKVSEMDTGDAINYTYKLFDIIVDGLIRGTHMNLGKLGVLGVNMDVAGNPKPTFRPSPDLRTSVKAYRGRMKNAGNKGLDEEGFARKWLEEHPDDTVIMRDGSQRTKTNYGL
jgi:hypothetical protein